MAMAMVVLVFVLQRMDGFAAALPVGICQTVEISQAFILEKGVGRNILYDAPLVHDQGAVGQLAHKEHIVADDQ